MHQVLARFCPFLGSILAALSLACSGCASHPAVSRPKQEVLIVSKPPGARIEINGQYVGDAPTTVEIEASSNGRFWKDTIIKAYPKDTGYMQILAFNGKSRWAISDVIPSRLFFDTRFEPGSSLTESNTRESQRRTSSGGGAVPP